MIKDIIIRAKKGTATVVLGQVDAGGTHSAYISGIGRAWAWGYNVYGALGDGTTTDRLTPVSVGGATKTFCKINTGGHSLAIDKNGKVWSWGNNAHGALGDGTTTDRLTPVSVGGATKTFCHISAGGIDRGITDDFGKSIYSLALDKNGRAWSWGYNEVGQLGDGTTVDKCTPVSVGGATKTFCKISAGVVYGAFDAGGA